MLRPATAVWLCVLTGCAPSEEPLGVRAQPAPLDRGKEPASRAEEHPYFSSVSIEEIDSVKLDSEGDLWASCWSDDDNVYSSNGDGSAFGWIVADVAVSRIEGRPDDDNQPLRGITLAVGDQVGPLFADPTRLFYNRKPTSMLCVRGDLYLAISDIATFDFHATPSATIVRSTDKGHTWTWDKRGPMFDQSVFTTLMFVDFGKDSEHARDEYAYVYGLDDNWSSVYSDRPPQTKLYLARVPFDAVQERARWEFVSGFADNGAPLWDSDVAKRVAVLEDSSRRYAAPLDPNMNKQNMTTLSLGGVIYDAPLQRYIYSTWTAYTFELYEAPEPWGPWTHFYTKDFGAYPWTDEVAGGYGTSLNSKFSSADGRTLYMHSNAYEEEVGVNHYQYSLRRVQLTPFLPSEASNERGPQSLATAELGAVPLVRAARGGHPEYLNDGKLENQSEWSWTGERKTEDYWGYTWPRVQRVNRVRYTTGAREQRGGFFSELGVQVRRGKEWVAVSGLTVSPDYASDLSVLGYRTYTLSFDELVTDGVRIYGTPGGADAFTNIAELSIHYE